jgi:hypothetical protein
MAQSLTLHIGAHRTATTSTQDSLDQLAQAGALGDVQYIPPSSLRREFAAVLRKLTVAPVLGRVIPLRTLAPDLAHARKTMRPLLLSEESVLGAVDPALRCNRGLYPDARGRLRAFGHLLRVRKARVVLVVRDYADWYASAYAMASVRRDLPPINQLSPYWINAHRGWQDIADDAITVFGSCEIIQFEALRADPRIILRALVGDAAENAPLVHRQRSISRDALQQVITARRDGEPLHLTVLNKLRDASENTNDPVRASPEAEDALRRRYEADIAAMRSAGYIFLSKPA